MLIDGKLWWLVKCIHVVLWVAFFFFLWCRTDNGSTDRRPDGRTLRFVTLHVEKSEAVCSRRGCE